MTRWTPTISICLLVWLVPFFAVIAPGHQRGAIKTPGSEDLAAGIASISTPKCVLCVFVAGFGDQDPAEIPVSPSNQAGDCAICHFNGTLLNPPPFELPNLKPVRIDLPLATAPEASWAIAVASDQASPRGPPA
ncbi:MAG: hypothetical protein AAGF84_05855 [Planctomycetota bacterium]